jgi:hypothetical protein
MGTATGHAAANAWAANTWAATDDDAATDNDAWHAAAGASQHITLIGHV